MDFTTRRPIWLAAVVFLCLTPAVWGCAFPKGACVPSVCNSIALTNFSAITSSSLFSASNTSIKISTANWPSRLAFYYSIYNPNYNGGTFDPALKADTDGAPFVNYFEYRNTLGRIAKTGVSMARCCNDCAKASGCKTWLFNPYVNRDKSFRSTGDCYFLLHSLTGATWTINRVNQRCTEGGSFTDSSVKPYFYAGTCNSDITDDPHFIGARGTRYDFNGDLDKSYCLLADTRLHINALLRGYKDSTAGEKGLRSWMKELGFAWVDKSGSRHTLRLVARSGPQRSRGTGFLAKVELDGRPMEIPSREGATVSGAGASLSFEGVGYLWKYEVDNFQLKIGKLLNLHLALRVAHPKLQTPEDAEVHFNMRFDGLEVTEKVHGILGQTYRQTPAQEAKALKYSALSQILGAPVQADGDSGKGFLEGQTIDYVTSSVTAPDCKFSVMTV